MISNKDIAQQSKELISQYKLHYGVSIDKAYAESFVHKIPFWRSVVLPGETYSAIDIVSLLNKKHGLLVNYCTVYANARKHGITKTPIYRHKIKNAQATKYTLAKQDGFLASDVDMLIKILLANNEKPGAKSAKKRAYMNKIKTDAQPSVKIEYGPFGDPRWKAMRDKYNALSDKEIAEQEGKKHGK